VKLRLDQKVQFSTNAFILKANFKTGVFDAFGWQMAPV